MNTRTIDKSNWVVNLSSKPLTQAERQILEKGPKFTTTPTNIPYKNIIAGIEVAITHLPDESKDSIRTTTVKTPSPEELVGIFFKNVESTTPKSYAVLPYIKGLTEKLQRTLRKHDIDVATKPVKTLQQQFPSPKYRVPMEEETGVVYQIPCKECPWTYIGETGRSFQTRKKEHMENVKNYAKESNIANHSWELGHPIDFENSRVIDKGDYRTRKTLESWHTAIRKNADNNARPLPGQYAILTKKRRS